MSHPHAAPEGATLTLGTAADLAGPADGLRRTIRLSMSGMYRRAAPRAVDTAGLDGGLRDKLRETYATVDQPYGALHCHVLSGALVTGHGSVVTSGGVVLRETAAGAVPAGFAADAAGGGLRLLAPPSRRIAAPSLLLKAPGWRDPRHALTEGAAALALATRLPLTGAWQIVTGQHDHAPAQQALVALCAQLAPGVPVVGLPDSETWQFDELLLIAPLHGPAQFHHPDGLNSLRALRQTGLLAKPSPPRRLFVRQGAHPAALLDNEAELAELAAGRGFDLIDPAQQDQTSLARLFRAAAFVAGAPCRAMVNLLFCASGAQCLLLSPGDHPDPFFWDMAAHAGAGFSELFGAPTARGHAAGHNPYRIDPERFLAMLPK